MMLGLRGDAGCAHAAVVPASGTLIYQSPELPFSPPSSRMSAKLAGGGTMYRGSHIALLMLFAAGCGGAPPTTVVMAASAEPPPAVEAQEPTSDAPEFAPASHYAALFEAGGSWAYGAARVIRGWDDMHPEADEDGNVVNRTEWAVTCTVGERVASSTCVAVTLGCDGDDRELLEGIWLADERGLWRVSELPTAEGPPPLPVSEHPVVAAVPEPFELEEEEDDGGGGGVRRAARRDDGAWCVEEAWWSGDSEVTGYCVAPGRGIISVLWGFSGGHDDDVTLDLVDP